MVNVVDGSDCGAGGLEAAPLAMDGKPVVPVDGTSSVKILYALRGFFLATDATTGV